MPIVIHELRILIRVGSGRCVHRSDIRSRMGTGSCNLKLPVRIGIVVDDVVSGYKAWKLATKAVGIHLKAHVLVKDVELEPARRGDTCAREKSCRPARRVAISIEEVSDDAQVKDTINVHLDARDRILTKVRTS